MPAKNKKQQKQPQQAPSTSQETLIAIKPLSTTLNTPEQEVDNNQQLAGGLFACKQGKQEQSSLSSSAVADHTTSKTPSTPSKMMYSPLHN